MLLMIRKFLVVIINENDKLNVVVGQLKRLLDPNLRIQKKQKFKRLDKHCKQSQHNITQQKFQEIF